MKKVALHDHIHFHCLMNSKCQARFKFQINAIWSDSFNCVLYLKLKRNSKRLTNVCVLNK